MSVGAESVGKTKTRAILKEVKEVVQGTNQNSKKKQVKNCKWGNVTDQIAKFCVAQIF